MENYSPLILLEHNDPFTQMVAKLVSNSRKDYLESTKIRARGWPWAGPVHGLGPVPGEFYFRFHFNPGWDDQSHGWNNCLETLFFLNITVLTEHIKGSSSSLVQVNGGGNIIRTAFTHPPSPDPVHFKLKETLTTTVLAWFQTKSSLGPPLHDSWCLTIEPNCIETPRECKSISNNYMH